MSNAAKKPNQTSPESYSPKKPEILSMAENAGKSDVINRKCEVKAANGGNYIDGVPMLRWGEWRDNSYCGCVTALFNAIGINITYEDVMGLSGACYKAIMLDDWCPSSEMLQNSLNCEYSIGNALGIDVYTIENDDERKEHTKKSIDAGFPVLLVGGRCEPEWTLICGYANENNECKFFGRTYFDYQPDLPGNEIYTNNKYYYSNGFPGWVPQFLTRFYDRKCEPISQKAALKVSLETCIKMFEQKSENHKFGYDAYDVLINGFELEDLEYKEKCRNDQYHIGSMQDARRAAFVYLEKSSDLLGDENKSKLLQAAKLYKTMFENMIAAIPYEKTSSVFNGSADPAWSIKQRQNLAKALRTNKELEKQVRVIVRSILEHWEG